MSLTGLKHGACAVTAVAVLIVGGVMTAVRASGAQPAAGGHDRNIAPIVFHPANSSINYVVEQGGLGRLCCLNGAGYFVAPLRLKEGTVIDRITLFLDDTNPNAVGMMSLVQRQPDSFEVLAVTPVSTGTGEMEALSTTTISAPVVDNRKGSYVLQVLLTGPGVCLRRAQVTYHTP